MLIKCEECGSSVSSQAEDCPKCANPLKNRLSRKGIAVVAVVIMLAIAIINRYELTSSSKETAFRLDRWTGTVHVIYQLQMMEVKEIDSN